MIYRFSEKLLKQGNRYFVKIPFNVWEECNQKGMISVKVQLNDHTFECRLVPKGNGIYYIPIMKKVADQLHSDVIDISFQLIHRLTRINHDSRYSIEHPIRKIDHIDYVTYPKDGYCGQICVAMLAGVSVEKIIEITQAKAWQCSFSKLIETLDYFGIAHADKVTYTKGKTFVLPACCILNVKDEPKNHFVLYYKGNYYGSDHIGFDQILGYLEITVA